jgi:hypothetical protein
VRTPLPPHTEYWLSALISAGTRWRIARSKGDKGAMSAEAMIIIAALTLVAVTVMGIVGAKIISKANQVNLGG